ncbi:DUF1992 domain-containing protein [Paenibacillus sp. NPDC058174]|uniref:DnaJ family domain-containing protein n=1 Tax=Paenibacillus sp. NPDC058174 TaxID=3346366 RepID=UPI0036D947B8
MLSWLDSSFAERYNAREGVMAMDWMSTLVEQRIQEAMARGEFDQLKGKGKPLELEDLSYVPEELRVGFKLLKNAGLVPEDWPKRWLHFRNCWNYAGMIRSGKR